MIPLLVHQVLNLVNNLSCVPNLLEGFADGYTLRVVQGLPQARRDVSLCEGLVPGALSSFDRLPHPAHRADLWRYCVLFLRGGIYMDIKTVPLVPLNELFHDGHIDAFTWYTVVTRCTPGDDDVADCWDPLHNLGRIYNGIIATPPGNPLLLDLMRYMVAHTPPLFYHHYVWDFTRQLCTALGLPCQALQPARNTSHEVIRDIPPTQRLWRGVYGTAADDQRLVLLEERCLSQLVCDQIGIQTDMYGLCCGIYAPATVTSAADWRLVLLTRDPNYPWAKGVCKHKVVTAAGTRVLR